MRGRSVHHRRMQSRCLAACHARSCVILHNASPNGRSIYPLDGWTLTGGNKPRLVGPIRIIIDPSLAHEREVQSAKVPDAGDVASPDDVLGDTRSPAAACSMVNRGPP